MNRQADQNRIKQHQLKMRQSFLKVCVSVLCVILPVSASAQELTYGLSGYLGYVGVFDDSESFECQGRSCTGVFDSSAIYALLGSARYKQFRATVLTNQDEDGEPRLTLAQVSYATLLGGWSLESRIGKIINPLGLYGANRITPTAAPRYELPQSFTLNSFFDLLTTSEYGFALEGRRGEWLLKGAYFRPEERTIQNLTTTTTTDNTGLGAIPGIGGLLGGLLGGAAGGGTVTTTTIEEIELGLDSWYAGIAYDQFEWRAEIGTVQLDLGSTTVSAYTAGYERELIAQLKGALELMYIEDENSDEPTQGYSAALRYELPAWQIIAQYTDLRNDLTGDLSDASIGIGTERGPWSARVVAHKVFDVGGQQGEDTTNLSILAAYSWR